MIAFLINELDIRGGTHKQLLKLLDYATEQNTDFIVLTKRVDYQKTYAGFSNYRDKIQLMPESRSCRLWKKPTAWIREIVWLRNRLKNIRVVNVHDNGFELYFAALPDKKVYWQINDLPPCFQTGVFANRRSWKNIIKRLWIRSGMRLAVREISVNVSKNRQRVQECLHRNARVFYCGIEPLSIHRSNDATFNRFENNTVHLLSSGVFFPYRNYETQIRIVKTLTDKGANVQLDIIGATADESYAEKIRKMIDENNLQQCITIRGSVDEKEFNRLHNQADLFLFINIDQSWGLAVFEAMSCGLPVLVSNSVGATEILHNGENALFVEPTDAEAIASMIIRLMQERSLYQSISNQATAFPEQYTWENAYSSRMLNLLSESV